MRHHSPRGFTLIEMLTVMAVIAILASLILSVNGFVQRKAATSRADGEIAAMSSACEVYKSDNGSYPRSNDTDVLDSKASGNPNTADYKKANLELYRALSGDATPASSPDGKAETNPYFPFKRDQLNVRKDANGNILQVNFIQDPFGNPYGYSTAGMAAEQAYQEKVRSSPDAARDSKSKGHNSTIDIWSTGGSVSGSTENGEPKDVKKWVKNW